MSRRSDSAKLMSIQPYKVPVIRDADPEHTKSPMDAAAARNRDDLVECDFAVSRIEHRNWARQR